MKTRGLLVALTVALVAANAPRLAAQRVYREYPSGINYDRMQERIRASVDRALERSHRTIERSTRDSYRVAERASREAERASRRVERAALRTRDRVDNRRYFDSAAFERRMDRLRDRLDDGLRVRMRDYRWRW